MAQFDLDSADGIQSVSQSTSPWITADSRGAAGFDAFGRSRVSTPTLISTLQFSNVNHDLLLNGLAAGTGTYSHSDANSSMNISTGGTASGASMIRQTKRYIKYNPGLSYLYTFAINIGVKKTNVTKRFGCYDELNGYFFEDDGVNLKIATRSNASGSTVDTSVNQSSWNLDKLDGSGASGITLDQTKHQLWVIDHIWHGAGPVRFGVHVNGKIVYAHQVLAGNTLVRPFTRTPASPLRVEIFNSGIAASATSIDVVCMTAAAEDGGQQLIPNYQFGASSGQAAKSVSTTLIPLISLRPKLTLDTTVNRIPIVLSAAEVVTNATYMDYYLIFNATLTGASFASVNQYSAAEVDTSATAYTGGTILYSSYANNVSKGGSGLSEIADLALLGLNIVGDTADILTVVARANSNNNPTFSAIRWEEFQ